MVTIRLYVEGGGEDEGLDTRCRKGFRVFLEKAGLKGRMPRIVPCGSRWNAYDNFRTAVLNAGRNEFPVLLVDSEGAVRLSVWAHLKDQDRWDRPAGATEDQAHLMVQCMEAWLVADRQHLGAYFGEGFIEKRLPGAENVERVPKNDLLSGLKMATRGTKKGAYSKGSHSFEILEGIDPDKVRRLPHAERFIALLRKKLT